jgi:SAM-dependent methyltransferase
MTVLEKIARWRLLGRSPLGGALRVNEWVWRRLPESVTGLLPVRRYGDLLHSLVLLHSRRQMYLGTFFLRNRPELALIRRLSKSASKGQPLKIAVLGSSNGAEVYSIMWAVRSAQRGVAVAMQAVDISPEVVAFAREGVYSEGVSEMVREPILERLTADEMREMFDRDGDRLEIKPWLKEGIVWRVGDAGDEAMVDLLGSQQIVIANRFLCHMGPADAERCLRNIARLVAPGGYLFVSGIDLDVRTRVAKDLGWTPYPDSMEALHDGDPSVRVSWPFKYWGLEPLDKNKRDWQMRYASVFQVTPAGPAPPAT